MNTNFQGKTVLLIFSVFLFFGCAVSENFKRGEELALNKRWEEAASFFERAVSEEPGNQEYKDALKRANQEAAKVIYERAKQSLDAAPEQNLIGLDQMAKLAERANSLDPSNKTISAFAQGIRDRRAGLQTKLKTLYAQAETDFQKEDWLSAIDKLKQVNKIFLNYEDTASRLAKAEQEGAKVFYQQGRTLSKQEEWKMAAQAFKSVIDINPGYYDAAKLYQEARSRDSLDYYVAEGDKAVSSQNWDRAIMLYDKATEYQPDNMDLRDKTDAMKGKVGQLYFADAVKLANQGILYKTLERLESARTYAPALSDDATVKDFVARFTGKLVERADRYSEKEQWGNAYFWLQKAEALNPNYTNLFQKLLDARDNINKRIRKSIAVFDFGAPSNSKDAGKIASNKLIAFLHKNASGDLRIIERENLQSILREMQLGQTGLVDLKAAQSVGKMRGIDTFIMGDVLQFSTNYVDRPSNAQERVEVNVEEVPNPIYTEWLKKHDFKPSAEDLKRAPPEFTKKPIYQFISYKKGTATVTAMIEISYKLVDTTTGENVFANTIAGKLIKEDKYQEGLAIAKIPADALEIPTEGEVIDELTNAKISDVGQSVLKQYQSLEVEYFNQGQQQEKRRNFELAVEKYTDAMFDEKLKGMATPISQKSQELITKLVQDK